MEFNPATQWRDPVQLDLLRRYRRCLVIFLALVFLLGVAVYWTIFADLPTDYPAIEDHFKYGSIGSEAGAGVPYWIWQVLPQMFPQHLPEPERFKALPPEQRTAEAGYAQFGFIYEDGHDVPIGMTRRRQTIELVGLNCAVCHVGTVKTTPYEKDQRKVMDPTAIYGGEPRYASQKDRVIVLGMPAHTVDLTAYIQFLTRCGEDGDFTEENVMAAIARKTSLGPLQRFFYRQAVASMRETVAYRDQNQLAFLHANPPAGPGRVDTFNPYKNGVFRFPVDGTVGTADFPSIWNQRAREGMRLHWDGDNTSVFERNISASLGAGATPVSLDMPRMLRVAAWLGAPDPHRPLTLDEVQQARAAPFPKPGELPIPKYPFAIDEGLAGRGAAIYQSRCAACHDWQGRDVGEVDPIGEIKTDPCRLDSFTPELAANQNTLGAGQWWRFKHFRKTNGYVNMPLDGLWARAPYLHNGSVPTLRDLLKPSADSKAEQTPQSGKDSPTIGDLPQPSPYRPKQFYRGDDEYDPANVGFRVDRPRSDDGRKLFLYDTSVKGNGNQGHEGPRYGTDLSESDKDALIEYLKKL